MEPGHLRLDFAVDGSRALAQCGGSVDRRDYGCELDRPAATGISARVAGAVCGEAALEVGRPAAVEAVVGAAEQVDVDHG